MHSTPDVTHLYTAPDEELVAILAAADAADIAMHCPGGARAPHLTRPASGTCEVLLLGALGCRYGMLSGGAGGHLVRTAATTVLVDPGPAALGMMLQLTEHGLFSWSELDAIAVTHLHPDHYAGLIPCLEGMVSYAATGDRKLLLANPTATERFAAFSPYHLGPGGLVDLVTLAHPATDGRGRTSVRVGDITLHAVPALHTEEAGRTRSAIGLIYESTAGHIWYTSDTNLTDALLGQVAAICPTPTMVIAHADASNIDQTPGRTEACHLETRDVPIIAAALQSPYVLIQHYDAAYSATEYRIAQAVWLQRQLDRSDLPTRVLPSASGLRLTLAVEGIIDYSIVLGSDAASAVADYLQKQARL
ncbi:ribonuclease BN (tRNA processing enzyme) [Streptosporangium becharense]|uniref:Ribonuclease BN (tRNA processing enzyme) n=1 Tax=Streptosporangium becharense TaxID=1816182 RepID=A0A7W9IB40_9ACTN|nr:MBL fold metallo-hydrolase [Streptosporangium becharense]MBB5817280.1 ribonuclease BN (tRNA processing enzyme) [Streptosporangium becharense]